MSYDIVDAFTDIQNLDRKLDYIISVLIEKKIMPEPKDEKAKGKDESNKQG